MRFAIFSDVHANRQAWEAVLADALRQRVGTLVCLGDVVGYGPKPQEVLTAVREATTNFVLGNHDAAACGRLDASIFNDRAREVIEWTAERLDEESLEFLRQVPLQMDGPGVQFLHAEVVEPGEFGYIDGVGPAAPNLRALKEPLAFIGHTHLPTAFMMAKKGGPVTQKPPIDFRLERGKRYIVNVGSVGEPRTTDVRASYVIYDDEEKTVNFRKVAFDVDAYVADLEESGLEIKPYFVRVVEAGKHSKPPPTAAPQLALTHLPKVTESVVGHHGSIVVGRYSGVGAPGGIPTVAGRSIGGVKQPRSIPAWMVIMLVMLVLVSAGAVAVFTMGGGEDAAAQNEKPAGEAGVLRVVTKKSPAEVPKAAPAPAAAVRTDWIDRSVPIKLLTVKVYPQRFENLGELRAAEAKGEESGEQLVKDGFVSLDAAGGHEAVGLIWEGRLVVPATGDYTFTLDSEGESALSLYRAEAVQIKGVGAMGRERSATVRLAKGHTTPFRLECFQRGGQRGLSLKWSGKGLENGEASLVRAPSPGAVAGVPTKEKPAAPPKPAPTPAPPKAPEKLSQALAGYWSFDARPDGPGRFTRNPDDGSVVERLILAKRSKARVLVPEGEVPADWKEIKFDDTGWVQGRNGVGYEDKAGPLADNIKTNVGKAPKRHPFSVLMRIPFEVEDPDAYKKLVLQTRYTGGFVAYVNGRSTARSEGVPTKLMWNSAAPRRRSAEEILEWKISTANSLLKLGKLVKGTNVLAIHALNSGGNPNTTNAGSASPAFLIQAELLALRPDADGVPEDPKPSSHDLVVAESSIEGNVKEVSGKFAEGFRFGNGTIKAGGKDKFAIGDGSFSVNLWFTRNPQNLDGQSRRLLSAGGGSTKQSGWAVYLSKQAGSVALVLGAGKQRDIVYAKSGKLADGEWHHLVVTADRSSGRVQIYLDGKSEYDKATKALKGDPIPSHSGLVIGGSTDANQKHQGMLDDVAIWKRALTPGEVRKIYKAEAGLGSLFNRED